MSNVEYKPAEKLQLRLARPDSSVSWGFRLQGGIDFSTPLSIQSVQPNGVSERCGLKAGDAILAINNATSDAMTHDEAKAVIMRSGNEIYMLVERGAVKIWKPQVTPLSELRPQELRTIQSATGEDITPVQKTSLAINKPPDEPCTIGSSHNRRAQPFGQPKVAVPNVVHSQYNSPMGLYSAGNIANSYSQQTQGIQNQMAGMDINDHSNGTTLDPIGQPVAATPEPVGTQGVGGAGGPDSSSPADDPASSAPSEPSSSSSSSYAPPPASSSSSSSSTTSSSGLPAAPMTPAQSAVYEEQKGDTPDYRGYTNPNLQSRTFNRLQEQLAAEEEENNNNKSNNNSASSGFRSVSAPAAKPPSQRPQQPSMRCPACDMLATGVIVKANGVPYHVACFKCAGCSMNLKQKGFFVVEGKLYCETCAKRRAQPPGSDMVAVPVYR
ncbi:PDZ and LIM domain protein 3 isoform X1 [Aplysia californica]|uniref:PDZ and LIM domain protein 3 isoform X1 n=1 Tax=Aplysia californica TaxID=6500 RepID=A0ABM0K6S1_APLCA|nr:PDZ and LIM domain protein 3 isoform X1 [Aplysia californica]